MRPRAAGFLRVRLRSGLAPGPRAVRGPCSGTFGAFNLPFATTIRGAVFRPGYCQQLGEGCGHLASAHRSPVASISKRGVRTRGRIRPVGATVRPVHACGDGTCVCLDLPKPGAVRVWVNRPYPCACNACGGTKRRKRCNCYYCLLQRFHVVLLHSHQRTPTFSAGSIGCRCAHKNWPVIRNSHACLGGIERST